MGDPTRPWGFFMIGLTLLLALGLAFHTPTQTPAPQVVPAYCPDEGGGLFTLCTDKWAQNEIEV
jgi:hypothetical protein